MQLFSNKGRPALALALKLVASSSLAYAQDSQNCQNCQNCPNSPGPISYLSASQSINVQYSWATNCDKTNSCLSAKLVPGACYNFVSTGPGGTPALYDNLGSLLGFGADGENFSCNVYPSPECMGNPSTISFNLDDVPGDIASTAASMRCGNGVEIMNDYMLVIAKLIHCTAVKLGGNCLTMYPYLSRCYDLSRSPNTILSAMANIGLSCTLYAANGCTGASATLPLVGYANLADLHFEGMANSFMCVGAM